jgi:hypothetical protein
MVSAAPPRLGQIATIPLIAALAQVAFAANIWRLGRASGAAASW